MTELSQNEKWFDERLCSCARFKYPSDADYNWEREFQSMLRPPYCDTCKKWANRVQLCMRCSQHYYQFFWHPLMGWEPANPPGWECWDCLETFNRHVTTVVNCRKTPPPTIVISPFHVKLEKPKLSVASQEIFDRFNAMLEEI